MEHQHERIAESLDRIASVLSDWEAAADQHARDRLVEAITDHRCVLEEHLDDEETELLPLASRHLNQQEWDALGEHFVHTTPKSQLLIFLGAVLEDADPTERQTLLNAMPLAARVVWRGFGRHLYTRRVRRIRGHLKPAPNAPPAPRTGNAP